MRLREFYTDKGLRKEVLEFLELNARELAAEYAFNGKPTAGFKEFKEILDNAESKLTEMFEVEQTPKNINHAK
jgi:hypothetical protein